MIYLVLSLRKGFSLQKLKAVFRGNQIWFDMPLV